MPKAILTPEEQAELNHLVAEHQTALHHAVEMASAHGMESPLFLVADKKAGELYSQIRKLLGATGQHWIAQ
jgi:hypothetical protein